MQNQHKYRFKGQPNAVTGTCDGDAMVINNSRTSFELCGWNSGQHGEKYYNACTIRHFVVVASRRNQS